MVNDILFFTQYGRSVLPTSQDRFFQYISINIMKLDSLISINIFSLEMGST